MTEPHPSGERWVAQEGAFAAATSNVPVLHYYPARGRAEPIRLTLAYVRQPWFEPPAGPVHQLVRCQLDSYPFRQLPRFVDEVNAKVDLVQSMAILRHLGRKYNLYGSGELDDAAAIDMIIDAVSDLRAKLKAAWGGSAKETAAMQHYTATVLGTEADLLASDEPGPGLCCLEKLLTSPPATEAVAGAGMQGSSSSSSNTGTGAATHHTAADAPAASGATIAAAAPAARGDDEVARGGADLLDDDDDDSPDGRVWFVGEGISIADIAVADLVDMNLIQFEKQVKSNFPHLYLHWRRVMGQPGIKDYLKSNNRHSYVWGQEWIDEHTGKGP